MLLLDVKIESWLLVLAMIGLDDSGPTNALLASLHISKVWRRPAYLYPQNCFGISMPSIYGHPDSSLVHRLWPYLIDLYMHSVQSMCSGWFFICGKARTSRKHNRFTLDSDLNNYFFYFEKLKAVLFAGIFPMKPGIIPTTFWSLRCLVWCYANGTVLMSLAVPFLSGESK